MDLYTLSILQFQEMNLTVTQVTLSKYVRNGSRNGCFNLNEATNLVMCTGRAVGALLRRRELRRFILNCSVPVRIYLRPQAIASMVELNSPTSPRGILESMDRGRTLTLSPRSERDSSPAFSRTSSVLGSNRFSCGAISPMTEVSALSTIPSEIPGSPFSQSFWNTSV